MFVIFTFFMALAALGLAHILIVVQLEPWNSGAFPVPPIYMAIALDVMALLLVYYV